MVHLQMLRQRHMSDAGAETEGSCCSASAQAKLTVPACTTMDSAELQGDVSPLAQRLLESGLSSGDWDGHAAHHDLTQVCPGSLQ